MKRFVLVLFALAALAFATSAEAGGLGRFGVGGCGSNGCGNFNSRVSVNHSFGNRFGGGFNGFGAGFSQTTTVRHRQGGLLNRRGGVRHVQRSSVRF